MIRDLAAPRSDVSIAVIRMAVKMAVMPRSLSFQHSAARTPLRCSMANEMPTALVHRAILIAQRFSSVQRNNAYRASASAESPPPNPPHEDAQTPASMPPLPGRAIFAAKRAAR